MFLYDIAEKMQSTQVQVDSTAIVPAAAAAPAGEVIDQRMHSKPTNTKLGSIRAFMANSFRYGCRELSQ
jgi:hypothetical protein